MVNHESEFCGTKMWQNASQPSGFVNKACNSGNTKLETLFVWTTSFWLRMCLVRFMRIRVAAEKHMDRNCSAQPIASSDEKTPAADMSTMCDCETPMTAHPTNDMITHGHRALGSEALRKKESPKAATIGVRLLIAAARTGSRRGRSRVRVSVFISSTSNVPLAQVSAAFKPVHLCSRRL